ncbi:MAG: DctP family TRAP transporter solute-binding subunit [candidate division Zixibacteria bacterium]|nr:DctP family TRAP transporter solute-binding subunit [candidate division Zixibacteria bacterium]
MRIAKLLCLFVSVLLVFAGVWISDLQAREKPIVLKLGNVIPPTSGKNLSCLKFSELVQTRTKNKVHIQVFPASQLGNEEDIVQGVVMGSIDLHWGDASAYSSWVKQFNVFNAPLLFNDMKHWEAVVRGPLFDGLVNRLSKKVPVRVLGRYWMGERYILTRAKPVYTPDDLRGLKLRVPTYGMFVPGYKALGANPTPINYAEVYMALQQGVVDGMENPVGLIRGMKFYEVTKYLTTIPVINAVNVLVINEPVFSALLTEYQKILEEAAEESSRYLEELMTKEMKENLKFFESKGLTIIQPKDLEGWRAKLKGFPEAYGKLWARPELYYEIQNYRY